ncbi:Eukaryotic/viral aspartic protease [Phytophthora megakarya]|uniref:Eukaryotic/viral aspartic protease n=1 Tax=Phytophthora megakarya TaxID=4795 RepID=A0A225WCZ8_9STRA|nr:Eukaryotic/viral aspartic protease [Phytophthora megakarya]
MIGDTPAANKVLGRTYEEKTVKSTWVRLFEPKRIRQAVWTDLSHELAVAVTATTTGQVASDTVQFLKSMRLQAQTMPTQAGLGSWIPAEAGAGLWKWKRKLRVGFGVTDIHYPQPPIGKTAGGGVDPSKIPLPKTPSKGYNTVPKSHGVFSKSGDETPYFQGSHMITPKSSGRKEQPDHDGGRTNATRITVRGSRRRWDKNRPEEDRLTQKIELATHRPLGQIRAFSGLWNKSENSMQWLRGFVYEMKGTRASPDEWYIPFQLSLKDGALHWHRQLPKKTKRTWNLLRRSFIRYYCTQYNQTAATRYYSAKREDKKHLCDYLN